MKILIIKQAQLRIRITSYNVCYTKLLRLKRHGGDATALVEHLTDLTVDAMYATSEENKFIEVTYANGEKEILYFKDFASGALIEGIVSRAKKYAVKRVIAQEGP